MTTIPASAACGFRRVVGKRWSSQHPVLRVLFQACLVSWAMLHGAPATAQTGLAAQAASLLNCGDSEDLLLELRLDGHVLSSGLVAHCAGQRVTLPLGEVARLLSLAIRVEPGRGTADGFVLDERRSFHLDAQRRVVALSDRQESLEASEVEVRSDDLYVAPEALARWLPADFDIDFAASRLAVRAREPLPLQGRLERERRGQPVAAAGNGVDPALPFIEMPYQLWQIPAVDLTVGANATRGAEGTSASGNATAYLTGDLLGLQSEAYLSGSTQPSHSQRLRLRLGRDDPEGHLLGPLHARSFALGSVSMAALDHVAHTSSMGNGLLLSNVAPTQSLNYGRETLQGDLPPGWDVELYVNEVLYGYQQARADGRYRFDDIALIYGRNDFRLVFHGPQGQLRVEQQSRHLDQATLPTGSFYYRLAAQEGPAHERRAVALFDWGLASGVSVSAGLSSLPLEGAQHHFASLVGRALTDAMLLSAQVVATQAGSLADLGLKTQLGTWRIDLGRVALTRNFVSEEYRASTDGVKYRDHLRLDGRIPLTWLAPLPVTLETVRERLRSGQTSTDTAARMSGAWRAVFVTQQLRWQSQAGLESITGSTQLSSRVASLGVRGGVGYLFKQGLQISDGSVGLEYSLSKGLTLTGGIVRNVDSAETHYNAAFTKTVGEYGLGVVAGHTSKGDTTVGVQLTMALAAEPRQGILHLSALPMAGSGAVLAHVFLDRDQDGVAGPGDEPLAGVAFNVDGSRQVVRTDAQGLAYIDGLTPGQQIALAVDPGSLEDPQWLSLRPGVRLTPRPGARYRLEFGIAVTGDIDGTVRIVDGGQRRGLAGCELELLDQAHQVVRKAVSEPDGHYGFEGVPVGTYMLRVIPSQSSPQPAGRDVRRIVTLAPDGALLEGIDFELAADSGEQKQSMN